MTWICYSLAEAPYIASQKYPLSLFVQGRSRSFTVIQGRWFWYQSKAHIRLPISSLLWLWSYFAPFLRYGDLFAENCIFFLPLSHSAQSLPVFPLEFFDEVNHEETIESCIWGYPWAPWTILRWRPHDRRLSCFDTVPAFGRQTDGRTDGRIYYSK